jgi:hypothetical protein
MTKQVQRRRGTATQHTSFTGAEGELSVNTTNKSVHVHDNVTAGGFEAARADMDNVTSSSILTAAGITATTAELNYVDGVTSAIQTQLDGKAGTASPTFTGTLTTANLTATGTTTLAGASTSADITFGDNDKAIFGAGSDLQIYHNGSNLDKIESSSAFLILEGSNIILRNNGGTEDYAKFFGDGAVELYSDNSKKLATTSTGVDITGTLTSDGLTVDGQADIQSGAALGSGLNVNRSGHPSYGVITGGVTDIYHAMKPNGGSWQTYMKVGATTGDISFYEDTGTTPKFFWDASAESLGIGNSTPSNNHANANNLVVGNGTAGGIANYVGTGLGWYAFSRDNANNSDAFDGGISYDGSRNLMFHTNAGTERMRILADGSCRWTPDGTNPDMTLDASGNLLVGKTNADFGATVGMEMRSNDTLYVARSGGASLALNRTTSDGAIAEFRKDGSTVGSIGTSGGRVYFADDSTNGITFSNSSAIMWPSNSSGGVVDNTMDIGDDDFRFKDLYLSGGVYLGGTGSANKLDDYEEGTWTPTWIAASGTITAHSNSSGRYTKIGRMVYVQGYISYQSNSSASGQVKVGGLPFTSVTTGFGQASNQSGGVSAFANSLWSSNAPDAGRIPANSTQIFPIHNTSTGVNLLQFSDFSTATNHSQFVFFGHYQVN